jgi:hypothetical protein
MHGRIQWLVVSASLLLFVRAPDILGHQNIMVANVFSPDPRMP